MKSPEEAKAKVKGGVVPKWARARQGQRGHGRGRGGPQRHPQPPGWGALSSSRSPGGSGKARPGGLPGLPGARSAGACEEKACPARAACVGKVCWWSQGRLGQARRERRWRKGRREGGHGGVSRFWGTVR